jgi:hypothetical protein
MAKMNAKNMRLRFDRAYVQPAGESSFEVVTTFSLAGTVIETVAPKDDSDEAGLKAAATATLKAIEQAVEGRFECLLEDLDHVSALGKNLIAVLVKLEFEGREFQLFGSCQVAGDDIAAAVRATLNATNRFVELASQSDEE